MIELVYMSRAHIQLTSSELETILHQSREYNARKGITGLLVYDGKGGFIQALEGPEHNVDALFEKISRDPRHARVKLLWRQPILKRAFGDWQMAYHTDEHRADMPGFSDFLSQSDTSPAGEDSGNFSLDLLKNFRLDLSQGPA